MTNLKEKLILEEAPDEFGLATDDELSQEEENELKLIKQKYANKKKQVQDKRTELTSQRQDCLTACEEFEPKAKQIVDELKINPKFVEQVYFDNHFTFTNDYGNKVIRIDKPTYFHIELFNNVRYYDKRYQPIYVGKDFVITYWDPQGEIKNNLYKDVANTLRTLDVEDELAKAKQMRQDEKSRGNYLLIKSSNAYDPEGLNIPSKSDIIISGEYETCKDELDKISAEAHVKADKEKDSWKPSVRIEKEGEDFIQIYYPNAIARKTVSIVRNPYSVKNESLTEEDLPDAKLEEPITIKVEEEPKQEVEDLGISSTLNDLIQKTYENIDFINSVVVTIADLCDGEKCENTLLILNDILDDEHTHIGQLQKLSELYSDNAEKIEDGKEKAEEIINNEVK